VSDRKRLDISDRQSQIINLVRGQGYASIEMMADRFGVSQQTVRRDIAYLSKANLLQRHHGGAGLPSGIDSLAYPTRKVRNAREKHLIGTTIAAQIPNGASLYIDIGTTMEAVAHALLGHEGLRVITNHIGVVSILCENTDFEIIMSGGLVRNRDRAVTGETTTEFLRQFRVGYGIFGIGSVADDGQLLDYDSLLPTAPALGHLLAAFTPAPPRFPGPSTRRPHFPRRRHDAAQGEPDAES